MAITPLPTPPSRSQSPATFSTDADAFLGALPDFATEANALAADVNADEASAAASATTASNAASVAVGAANYMGDYNAGTTYQIGKSVSYNGRRYVAKTVNTGITPVEGANWLLINDGDVLGPVSATNNALAVYDGTTGKLIKDGAAPGAVNNVLVSNGTTWTSGAAPSSPVNYPQNIQSANYTLVLSDAGKMIFHPVADTTIRTYTIPANASVPFPIGTVVLFTVENGAQSVIAAITSDTLVLSNGTTGSVVITSSNTLTAIKVTATKWIANLDFQLTAESIAVSHEITPFVSVYPWSGGGFGTKIANPTLLPEGNGQYVAFSPSGNAIAVANSAGGAQIAAYPWSGGGFGTRFAYPSTTPTGAGLGVAFSPAGNAIAVAHINSPYVSAYPWSGSGFGTKFADPATLPASNGRAVAFSPDGSAIAVAHDTSPYVSAYPWSGSGFGTKFANPATLPSSTAYGVEFSPAGDAIALASGGSPYILVYPWSGSGFGTKYANPATLPNGGAEDVAFSPAGNAIAVAHNNSPYVSAYPWSSSGFGTKYANPTTLPGGTVCYSVAFNSLGTSLAVAIDQSPYVNAYSWSSAGFGGRFSNPATLPTGPGTGVAFTMNP